VHCPRSECEDSFLSLVASLRDEEWTTQAVQKKKSPYCSASVAKAGFGAAPALGGAVDEPPFFHVFRLHPEISFPGQS